MKSKVSKKKAYPGTEGPPGRIKIANALRELLAEKDFNSITTSEISKRSGVNESLIYRYFGDKRGLLHEALRDHLDDFVHQVATNMEKGKNAFEKMESIIRTSLDFYDGDRVFSRMLLIEVRNYPGYFESETYMKIKEYTNLLLKAIQEGIAGGEIKEGVSSEYIRQILLGAIEHMVLPALIHNGEINKVAFQKAIGRVVFDGIRNH